MSKEALYNPDRRCIFRETFNSEQDALNNNALLSDDYSFVDGSFYGEDTGGIYKNNFISLYNRTEFTLRLRLRINDENIDLTRLFAGNGSNADNTTRIAIANHTSSLYCFISDGVSNCYTTHTVTPYLDGEYHDYIMVFDGSLTGNYNRAKMYVDGLLVSPTGSSGTIPSSTPDTFKTFMIESYSVNTGIRDKNVDLLEVYDVALSAEEVYNMYHGMTYKDVTNGMILNVDAFSGIIQDRMGNDLTYSGCEVIKDNINVCRFDGTSQTGITSPITFPSTDVTVNLWFKLEKIPVGSYYTYHALFGASGSSRLILRNTINSISPDTPTQANIVFDNSRYLWNMYTVSIDAIGRLLIYINGKLIGTLNSGQSFQGQMYFGAYGNIYYRAVGCQNQQRVYNRVLSANEVSQLYTSQKHNYE